MKQKQTITGPYRIYIFKNVVDIQVYNHKCVEKLKKINIKLLDPVRVPSSILNPLLII